MTIRVPGLVMKDYNGNEIEVNGVLSSDHNFVIGSAIRKFKTAKETTGSNGSKTATIGMGDIAIFGIKSVEINGDEAIAETFPIFGTTSVNIIKYTRSEDSEPSIFPVSIINHKIVQKNDYMVAEVKDLLPESLAEAINTAVNLTSGERAKYSKNNRFADLSQNFMDAAMRVTKAEKPVQETGMTVDEAMSANS